MRKKLKLSSDTGNSGSKKCKWGYGGVWWRCIWWESAVRQLAEQKLNISDINGETEAMKWIGYNT
jgi:hypothetical protein